MMDATILAEIEGLRKLNIGALRTRYREVFGEESRSSNKQFLFRRIAWRLQARVEGDLSERAHRRALEIADDADLRIRVPVTRQDHRIGPEPEGTGGFPFLARCSPASLKTVASSSRFLKQALNISLSSIAR